jgi:hypothetical protein
MLLSRNGNLAGFSNQLSKNSIRFGKTTLFQHFTVALMNKKVQEFGFNHGFGSD